jgi:hypothetical protein
MRLSRGIWIMGLCATLFTLLNVLATELLYGLWCIDTCNEDVGTIIAQRGSNALAGLFVIDAFLIPCLVPVIGVWIWMLVDVRRQRAARLLIFGYTFPVLSLALWVVIVFLTSSHSQKALVVYTGNLWIGSFALVLWPLLVTLVAIFWHGPAQSGALPSETASGAA